MIQDFRAKALGDYVINYWIEVHRHVRTNQSYKGNLSFDIFYVLDTHIWKLIILLIYVFVLCILYLYTSKNMFIF